MNYERYMRRLRNLSHFAIYEESSKKGPFLYPASFARCRQVNARDDEGDLCAGGRPAAGAASVWSRWRWRRGRRSRRAGRASRLRASRVCASRVVSLSRRRVSRFRERSPSPPRPAPPPRGRKRNSYEYSRDVIPVGDLLRSKLKLQRALIN